MPLASEIARIRKTMARYAELIERSATLASSIPLLAGYSVEVAAFVSTLQTRVDAEIVAYEANGEHAINNAKNLCSSLERVLGVIQLPILRARSIPFELSEFVFSCLDRCGIGTLAFGIAIDDKWAHYDLRQIYHQMGLAVLLSDFDGTAAFPPNTERHLAIFLIPERDVGRNRSIRWPLIAHEVAHAALERHGIIPTLIQHVSQWLHETRRALHERDRNAEKALFTTEYACDEIATRLTGSSFVWRLVEDVYATQGDVAPATTHPAIASRVERALKIAAELGFVEDSRLLRDLSPNLDRDVQHSTTAADEELLREILTELHKRGLKDVTHDRLVAHCDEHNPRLTVSSARQLLADAEPVAVADWEVLCLAVAVSGISASDVLQEAVADSIRLGQVLDQFAKVFPRSSDA